jgi:hypothetical protein
MVVEAGGDSVDAGLSRVHGAAARLMHWSFGKCRCAGDAARGRRDLCGAQPEAQVRIRDQKLTVGRFSRRVEGMTKQRKEKRRLSEKRKERCVVKRSIDRESAEVDAENDADRKSKRLSVRRSRPRSRPNTRKPWSSKKPCALRLKSQPQYPPACVNQSV